MRPPAIPPCPTCQSATVAFEPVPRTIGITERIFWRIACTSCGTRAGVSSSKATVLTWWRKGQVLTPLQRARVDKELIRPHIVRNSFPGLGQQASRYPLISGLTAQRHIRFCPGKYGRVDKFYLDEWLQAPSSSHRRISVVDLDTQPGDETLPILRELDRLVEFDPELIAVPIREGGREWLLHTRKDGAYNAGYDSAALYERRLIEQERLLKGEIKRGHKAFGFMPLDGYR